MHLTLPSVDHLQDVFKLFLANTLEKDERVWMLVAKKKVLENLEDGDGEDGDDDEKEDSGDDRDGLQRGTWLAALRTTLCALKSDPPPPSSATRETSENSRLDQSWVKVFDAVSLKFSKVSVKGFHIRSPYFNQENSASFNNC